MPLNHLCLHDTAGSKKFISSLPFRQAAIRLCLPWTGLSINLFLILFADTFPELLPSICPGQMEAFFSKPCTIVCFWITMKLKLQHRVNFWYKFSGSIILTNTDARDQWESCPSLRLAQHYSWALDCAIPKIGKIKTSSLLTQHPVPHVPWLLKARHSFVGSHMLLNNCKWSIDKHI